MPIITILVVLIVAGLILWLVETQLPIAAPFKLAVRVILVLCLCLWLLSLVGVLSFPVVLR